MDSPAVLEPEVEVDNDPALFAGDLASSTLCSIDCLPDFSAFSRFSFAVTGAEWKSCRSSLDPGAGVGGLRSSFLTRTVNAELALGLLDGVLRLALDDEVVVFDVSEDIELVLLLSRPVSRLLSSLSENLEKSSFSARDGDDLTRGCDEAESYADSPSLSPETSSCAGSFSGEGKTDIVLIGCEFE